MKQKFPLFILIIIAALTVSGLFAFRKVGTEGTRMVSIRIDPKEVAMFWKDDKGRILSSLQQLKIFTESQHKQLVFAMNGGMYQEDQSPLGLYVEQGKIVRKLNTVKNAYGNFYMQPNGVFYITNANNAVVCTTDDYKGRKDIKYATQSGPMLVIDGRIHPSFTQGSKNVNVRNGVGVLPDGSVVLAMSKDMVSLYDFAAYFKNLGCKNALFLDGFISRTYYSAAKWNQLDGNFGVMIGVVRDR